MLEQVKFEGKLETCTKKKSLGTILFKDIRLNKYLYLMMLPAIIYYIVFHYQPMYGVIIAFKNFNPAKGILASDWVGLKHFQNFFNSYYFLRILKNTLFISINSIVWGFPAPLILALLLNEVKNKKFKSTVQTVTYLPHFISMVIICSMVITFTSSNGVINQLIAIFRGQKVDFLMKSEWFMPVYVLSGIWQEVGWGSIIYLAALSGIDKERYEAAEIDGAGRWKKLIYVTIPGIIPTVITLLILRMGGIMNVGFEKVLLLYNPTIYSKADVISTFVYRRGIAEAQYSYSAAVGLFNTFINFIMLYTTNKISNKINGSGIW